VSSGQKVRAGEALTAGSSNPQEILQILGKEHVQRYLIDEVQRVYRSQGVNTNEKHMEITVRQMLRKVQIDTQGDTDLLAGELVDRFQYEEINSRVLAEGGEPATASTVLLGVTKAALKVDSFLSAASFQETTRVLTEAAIQGSIDRLHGLKENVIIGKLIPAGSGIDHRSKTKSRVSLSVLLDIDPDNAEQLAYLQTLEEEIEDEPEKVPEMMMQLPEGIATNGNLVLDGEAASLDEEEDRTSRAARGAADLASLLDSITKKAAAGALDGLDYDVDDVAGDLDDDEDDDGPELASLDLFDGSEEESEV
jgi:DNA-directed RNA polymerase subunit beta'